MGRFLLCWLAVAGGIAGGEPLRVGRAAVRITPEAGTPMGSSYGLTISKGVHDELHAKAIVLDKDGARAALVACDLISLRPPVVAAARRAIEKSTGLAGPQVLISATHSHAGPQMHTPFLELIGGKAQALGERYRETLPEKIAEAVRLALEDLRPARAWAGTGNEPSLVFNRRFHMRDGSVIMNPGRNNPNALREAAGTDPEVPVVYFESLDGEALATCVNYALHCAVAGGPHFSADYPYTLSRLLARIKGDGMLTLFQMGTAGDVNHLDTRAPRQLGGAAEAERIGTVLAGEVLKTYTRMAPADGRLQWRLVRLPLPVRAPAPGEREKAQSLFSRYGKPGEPPFLDVVWAWRTLDTSALAGRPVEADVQVITLGDQVAWVGLPGEIFVELGLAVKARSPFRVTAVSGMSASGTISYVPTRKAFGEGSYEVLSARIAPGGGEALAEAAAAALQQLRETAR